MLRIYNELWGNVKEYARITEILPIFLLIYDIYYRLMNFILNIFENFLTCLTPYAYRTLQCILPMQGATNF